MAQTPTGFGPLVKGVSKTDAPGSPKDLIGDLVSKMTGKGLGPRLSAGDKVAQAVQWLREAATEDVRMAPLINGPLMALVTGQEGMGQPSPQPQQPQANPMMGPASQAAGGMKSPMPMGGMG